MKFIEVKIYTNTPGVEQVLAMLMGMGIVDVVVDDPNDVKDMMEKKNTYDWDFLDEKQLTGGKEDAIVKIYLEETDENKATLSEIKKETMMLKSREYEGYYGDITLGKLYVEDGIVSDDDWKDKWKEYFKPSKITDKLVVKPSWEDYQAKEGEYVIEIDPGMAFGTGTHETTSMTMQLMEKYMEAGDSVLDVGCGSGILGIGAGLLGAGKVLAIDIDKDAVSVAKDNVAKNSLSDIVSVGYGDLTKGVKFEAEVAVANLIAELVIALSGDVAKHLSGKGIFISSGILVDQADRVRKAIQNEGFEILETLEKGEWCAIAAKVKK